MNTVLLLIIGLPIIEIYLMIKVGGIIGAFNTIFLIFFTAITGIYFARLAGLNTIRSGINQLIKNELPVYEIISGAALAFAALLLVVPGFLTDIVGFLLILPISRKFFINSISTKFKRKNENTKSDDKIIEGEYEEQEKDKKKDLEN